MLVRDYLIILVMITMSVTAIVMFIGDANNNYGTNIDTSYNVTYNKIAQTETLTNQVQQSINEESKIGFLGLLDFLVSGAWKALKVMLGSISIFGDMIKDLGNALGFSKNNPLVNGFSLIITIGLLFAILSAIFRRKI